MRQRLMMAFVTFGVSALTYVPVAHASEVIVKSGETFWSIADQHHVSVNALQAANPSVDPNHLQIGVHLKLPATANVSRAAKAKSNTFSLYVVQRGDTLWSISSHFHVSIASLQTANPGLTPTTLRYGTRIRIPTHGSIKAVHRATAAAPRRNVTSNTSSDDLMWMARIIYAEAHDQPMPVLIAVGDVVWHRMLSSPGFTVKDVVLQKTNGQYQFSTAGSGLVYQTPDAASWSAAKAVLERHEDLVPGAYYFYNASRGNAWLKQQAVVRKLNEMVFAK